MRKILSICFLTYFVISTYASAVEISGTWKFEKSAEYFGEVKNIPTPEFKLLQILNGAIGLQPRCSSIKLKKDKFLYSRNFQVLLRRDVDDVILDQYLNKNFTFSLLKLENFYSLDEQSDECNKDFKKILASDNKLIVVVDGSIFYSYVRSDGETSKPLSPNVALHGHKLSHLPFKTQNYASLCWSKIPRIKGMPQSTEKCAPIYFPYVATKKELDPLTQLIGTHNYKKGGAHFAEDYDNPLANNLHPTFVVLPPLKDVILVRVDDFEPGPDENREQMSGLYLAIKDGKVTDQLNSGCDFSEKYICVDDHNNIQYQLLDTGKFRKLN